MRPIRALVLAPVALLALTACVAAAGTPPVAAAALRGSIAMGRSTQTVTYDRSVRTVHLYRPAGLTSHAIPLVVMLHGGYGTGTQAENSYGWDAVADSGHFIVAYPDGVGRSWNAGSCCGTAQARDVDDVGFILAMVTKLEGEAALDHSRIYVTGMSNGAMMAYRLACDTHVFAAAAPVAGTILVPCAHATPTSVIHIHGTADPRVPYNGGPGEGRTVEGTARVDGPSVPADNATWRSIDGCAAPTISTSGSVTTSTAPCPQGRSVELISIAGAGHQWPGGKDSPVADKVLGLDPPSTAIDATSTIWSFLSAHSL